MVLAALMKITTILLALASFSVGIFSLLKNPKSPVVRLWFFASMAVTVWSLGYIKSLFTEGEEQAYQALKIVYFGASLIPILFFHFVAEFLYKAKNYKYLIYFGYIVAVAFVYLTTLTKYIISGSRYLESFGRYEEVETPGFYLFLAYFFFFTIFAIYLLFRDYFVSDGLRKKQIFYIIAASVIGFAGGTCNFITDIFGGYPYGQYFVWLYPLLITYGIFIDEIKIKIKF